VKWSVPFTHEFFIPLNQFMAMSPSENPIAYSDLVALVDKLLEESNEDDIRLARELELIEPGARNELLVSDLLNAYQVFYYFFRIVPDALVKERMELEPASALVKGMKIDEIELLEMIFVIKGGKPSIVISDGVKSVITFSGRNAYSEGLKYLENPEYS
jgi:hypothetical protein